jgi:hypothetical protein
MDDKKLQWLIAVIVVFIGVAYFMWLVLVYIRFSETDQYVRKIINEHFKIVPGKVADDS